MNIWAVVPAAGTGSRLGAELPKQYLDVAGRPLLEWSVRAVLACERVRGCMVAVAADDPRAAALTIFDDPRVLRCVGGATRAASVAAALAALDADPQDWVLVHDAARPCLPRAALEMLIDCVLDGGTGGLLAQPQSDTLKRVDADGNVVETLPREGLWRAQTPQMFPLAALAQALAAARDAGVTVTDEASAMERAGHPVRVVEGPACNLKVTYADDVAVAARWLGVGAQSPRAGAVQ